MSKPDRGLARYRAGALAAVFASALALVAGMLGAPTIAAAAPGEEATIFGTATPAVPSDPDTSPVELGVAFVPRVDGTVGGVRFFKGAGNTGRHTGSLWSPAGSRLATATFSQETASGWQAVEFASPVPVTAGKRYVASYHAPRGRYAAASGFFRTAYTSGDLTVPVNGGVYKYGRSGLPTSTYNATNYYVDLLFRPAVGSPPPSDTRAPVISGVAASAVSQTSATIRWTTDEPSTSQVAFGVTTAYGSKSPLDSSLTTSHTVSLAGLTAGTKYYFQALSSDAAANSAASTGMSFSTAASTDPGAPAGPTPGNPDGTATVPAGMGLEDVSNPDHVIGDGTSASCTSAAVLSAVTAGGVITFDCGPEPKTITLTQTARVRNSTRKLVIDGGGKVTLSGGGTNRILYVDTCDSSLGSVSGNCLYAPQWPQVAVQNVTFADGNATNAPYVSPGDTNQGSNGGGAIFALGGRLKVVRSTFVRNTCAVNGPDLGGAAIRVLAQHSATPNNLDDSYAARNQDPVYIVQSTFGGASGQGNACSNGGAISGLRTPITVLNSLITHNNAVGCCANPAKPGTPGGGSGGAIYTDGGTYDLNIVGTRIESNTAKAGGSSIFYVSNDRSGRLIIDRSISRNNTYAPSGQPTSQSFENYPGIFYLGNGNPVFTSSTIQ